VSHRNIGIECSDVRQTGCSAATSHAGFQQMVPQKQAIESVDVRLDSGIQRVSTHMNMSRDDSGSTAHCPWEMSLFRPRDGHQHRQAMKT
jgi:hypothetical protein